MKDQECVECSTVTPSCTECRQVDGTCEACEDGFVLTDQRCRPFAEIDQCTEAHDSVSTFPALWKRPNPSRTGCESHSVWWVILLGVLVVFICFVIAVTVIAGLVLCFNNFKKRQQQERTPWFFEVKNGNFSLHHASRSYVLLTRRSCLRVSYLSTRITMNSCGSSKTADTNRRPKCIEQLRLRKC